MIGWLTGSVSRGSSGSINLVMGISSCSGGSVISSPAEVLLFRAMSYPLNMFAKSRVDVCLVSAAVTSAGPEPGYDVGIKA